MKKIIVIVLLLVVAFSGCATSNKNINNKTFETQDIEMFKSNNWKPINDNQKINKVVK